MDNQCNTLADSSPSNDPLLDTGDAMETGSSGSRNVTGLSPSLIWIQVLFALFEGILSKISVTVVPVTVYEVISRLPLSLCDWRFL